MARTIDLYTLLVSCPTDVEEERKIIAEVVKEFNRLYGEPNSSRIELKHWSKDSYPESGGSAQSLLNKQLILDSDMAVALFWKKFGSPTDDYESGTEEEIELLLKERKQVFLYFSDVPIAPSEMDSDQYKKIVEFKEKYRNEKKGIYHQYDSLDSFKSSFRNHLALHFIKLFETKNQELVLDTTLSVKGVNYGSLTEFEVRPLERSKMGLDFLNRIKQSVLQKIIEVQQIGELLNKKEENENDFKLNQNLLGMGTPIYFDKDFKDKIIDFGSAKNIDINSSKFFSLGDLKSVRNLIVLPGNSTYNLKGDKIEEDKYFLILSIYKKIIEYYEWKDFLEESKSKYYIHLALSNFGNNIDEDIDVELYIPKNHLCKKDSITLPGNSIIEAAISIADEIYKPTEFVNISLYSDYDIFIKSIKPPTYNHLMSYSSEEMSEKYLEEYKEEIDIIFCYQEFENEEFDILRYNQKYLKHNTNMSFPSLIVLNSLPQKIKYKIRAKYHPSIIEGDIAIK